jgi:hypothetical protein
VFISTATATGAAATRLALVARGLPEGHPTRNALGTIETVSMLTELTLSHLGERRMGDLAEALRRGRPGIMFRTAKLLVAAGLSLRLLRRRAGPRAHDLASVLYLSGGLAFRYAWVYAGKDSAQHHEAVAAMARGGRRLSDQLEPAWESRAPSTPRRPLQLPSARRAYGEAVRRVSLAIERRLQRRSAASS